MKLIVSFCCNDERGHESGRVTAIHLPEGMLDLETEHERGLTFREVRPHQIRVSRRTWRVYGYRPWYGNLFWNGYAMKDRDVIQMLVWAKESKKFQCDGGWTTLCDWWDRNTGYDEAPYLLGQFNEAYQVGGSRPAGGTPMTEWQTGKPPNEQVVEVEYKRAMIRVRAIWGRDGTLPHWESEDGDKLWNPRAFSRWRTPETVV